MIKVQSTKNRVTTTRNVQESWHQCGSAEEQKNHRKNTTINGHGTILEPVIDQMVHNTSFDSHMWDRSTWFCVTRIWRHRKQICCGLLFWSASQLLMIGNSFSLLCCHPNVHCLFVQIVSESPFLIGHIISSTSIKFHVVSVRTCPHYWGIHRSNSTCTPKSHPLPNPCLGRKSLDYWSPVVNIQQISWSMSVTARWYPCRGGLLMAICLWNTKQLSIWLFTTMT